MIKKYEKYKESGIDWLKETPSGWPISKFKRFGKIRNGKDQKAVLTEDGDYPVLGTGGEFGRANEYLYDKPSVLLGRKGTIDKPQYIEEPFWTVDTLFYTEIFEDNFPKYLYYFSQIFPFSLLQESSAVPSVTQGKLNNLELCKPSLQEQIKIAEYLDHQTSLIDGIIEKKQLLIKKLKEQRQAIINEAVTKGLNPDVRMKDSGVEWLGKIPEHWGNTKFQRICFLQQGLQIPINERFYEPLEGALEYITTKSVHNPNDQKQYVLNPKASVTCISEDILLGRTGNTGEVVSGVEGVFHNNFFKINYNKEKANKKFLIYFLKTTFTQEIIRLVAGTTTIPDLNHGDFLSLSLFLPPITEQLEIVKSLNKRLEKINNVTSKIHLSIIDLKKYRQSLISEAVTGKIDVREWEPKTEEIV